MNVLLDIIGKTIIVLGMVIGLVVFIPFLLYLILYVVLGITIAAITLLPLVVILVPFIIIGAGVKCVENAKKLKTETTKVEKWDYSL